MATRCASRPGESRSSLLSPHRGTDCPRTREVQTSYIYLATLPLFESEPWNIRTPNRTVGLQGTTPLRNRELGLACTLKLQHPTDYEVFVIEAIQFRLNLTLSDYKGREPLVHDGTCHGMLASLLDTFQTNVPDAANEFRRPALILRKSAALMKHRATAPRSFARHCFVSWSPLRRRSRANAPLSCHRLFMIHTTLSLDNISCTTSREIGTLCE